MAQGNINVQAENIFPIIKQFLYSDQEIFLRELVSNAVDACKKLQALSSMGEAKGDIGELQVEVIADKKAKTLTIRDNGLGMTGEEIEKYIAQIAFSGAEEFVQKYEAWVFLPPLLHHSKFVIDIPQHRWVYFSKKFADGIFIFFKVPPAEQQLF